MFGNYSPLPSFAQIFIVLCREETVCSENTVTQLWFVYNDNSEPTHSPVNFLNLRIGQYFQNSLNLKVCNLHKPRVSHNPGSVSFVFINLDDSWLQDIFGFRQLERPMVQEVRHRLRLCWEDSKIHKGKIKFIIRSDVDYSDVQTRTE